MADYLTETENFEVWWATATPLACSAWEAWQARAELDSSAEVQSEQLTFPHECKTDAEKTAYAAGWWNALENQRNHEQPVSPPQNHVWVVSNKVATMGFWSEDAARKAGAFSGSMYMDVTRLNLLDVPTQPVQPAPDLEALRADAARWNRWLPWLRNVNRKPFDLAMDIARIDKASTKKTT